MARATCQHPPLRSSLLEETDMPEAADCVICERIALWRKGANPYFIHEFKHSIFVVGDHQFHEGYSLVLLKKHVSEMHELPDKVQAALFKEVVTAARALVATFHPWKMNYSCFGNAEPHVHWH